MSGYLIGILNTFHHISNHVLIVLVLLQIRCGFSELNVVVTLRAPRRINASPSGVVGTILMSFDIKLAFGVLEMLRANLATLC
jgi:hypothetical protein